MRRLKRQKQLVLIVLFVFALAGASVYVLKRRRLSGFIVTDKHPLNLDSESMVELEKLSVDQADDAHPEIKVDYDASEKQASPPPTDKPNDPVQEQSSPQEIKESTKESPPKPKDKWWDKHQGYIKSLMSEIPIDLIQFEMARILYKNAPFYTRHSLPESLYMDKVKSFVAHLPKIENTYSDSSFFSLQHVGMEILVAHTAWYAQEISRNYKPHTSNDFNTMGRHLRAYSQLSTLVEQMDALAQRGYNLTDTPMFTNSIQVKSILMDLRTKLFPWFDYKKYSFHGRGIVIATGDHYFTMVVQAVAIFRHVLRTRLPIEIMYAGKWDLREKYIRILESFDNVKAVDIFDYVDNRLVGISGWSLKPYSILTSSFQEVIFMDADVLFMQDPANMFEMKGYKESGAVFFHDRQMDIGKAETHVWAESFLYNYSEDAKQLQFLKHKTIHEQDSGVVVVNKGSPALYGLLATCNMNRQGERDYAYKFIHGDKETFWASWEMMKLPYYFPSDYGGTIGYLNPNRAESVCGQLFHADEKGQPLWWNGGVYANKHFSRTRFIQLTHFATNKYADSGHWDWEKEDAPFCLAPKRPQEEIQELNLNEKAIGKMMVDMGKQINTFINKEESIQVAQLNILKNEEL